MAKKLTINKRKEPKMSYHSCVRVIDDEANLLRKQFMVSKIQLRPTGQEAIQNPFGKS